MQKRLCRLNQAEVQLQVDTQETDGDQALIRCAADVLSASGTVGWVFSAMFSVHYVLIVPCWCYLEANYDYRKYGFVPGLQQKKGLTSRWAPLKSPSHQRGGFGTIASGRGLSIQQHAPRGRGGYTDRFPPPPPKMVAFLFPKQLPSEKAHPCRR